MVIAYLYSLDGYFGFGVSDQGDGVKDGHVELHDIEQLGYGEDFVAGKAVAEENVSYHR